MSRRILSTVGLLAVVGAASAGATVARAESGSLGVLPAEGDPALAARIDAGLAVELVKGGHADVLTSEQLAQRLGSDSAARTTVGRGEALLERANQALLHLRRAEAIRRAKEAIAALEQGNARFHARPLLGRAHGALAGALMLKPADSKGAQNAFVAALDADAAFRPDADRAPPRVLERFNAAKQVDHPVTAPSNATLMQVAMQTGVQRLVWVGLSGQGAAARVEMSIFEVDKQSTIQLQQHVERDELVSATAELALEHLPGGIPASTSRPAHQAVAGIVLKPGSQPAVSAPVPTVPETAGELTKPWYKRWWVWAIVGTAVVAAGTGVAIGVTQSSNDDNGYRFVFKY